MAEGMTKDALTMLEWLDRYRPSAYLYVTEVLGAVPEPWQAQVLRDYDTDRTKNADGTYAVRISIASGHGVGKTALLAWIASHHQVCYYPQKTAITAPSAPQLWDALWPEIKSWNQRLPARLNAPTPLLDTKAERIDLVKDPANSFTSAKTSRSDQAEALQGVHSGGHVLLIGDEASGIPDAVFDAAGGSMAGQRVAMILAGNPLRGTGYFYDTHHKMADRWRHYTVSVFDSKWSSPAYALDIESRYGKDSNHYRTRVLGLFPTTDDDVVIPYEMAASAVGRDVKPIGSAPIIWGLDVAAMGAHRSALCKRRAHELLEPPKAWGGLDDAQVAGHVKMEWDVTPVNMRPVDINVDSIGYGAAVVTRLRELGLPARGINVSEVPSLKNSTYRNLKAELWFATRAWFAKRDAVFPLNDKDNRIDDLVEELTTPTAKFQPISGKILIEEKKGRRSPDLADAFVLTMASESFTLTGLTTHRDWKKPLSNPIKGMV